MSRGRGGGGGGGEGGMSQLEQESILMFKLARCMLEFSDYLDVENSL